jgi:hypothetical protein
MTGFFTCKDPSEKDLPYRRPIVKTVEKVKPSPTRISDTRAPIISLQGRVPSDATQTHFQAQYGKTSSFRTTDVSRGTNASDPHQLKDIISRARSRSPTRRNQIARKTVGCRFHSEIDEKNSLVEGDDEQYAASKFAPLRSQRSISPRRGETSLELRKVFENEEFVTFRKISVLPGVDDSFSHPVLNDNRQVMIMPNKKY